MTLPPSSCGRASKHERKTNHQVTALQIDPCRLWNSLVVVVAKALRKQARAKLKIAWRIAWSKFQMTGQRKSVYKGDSLKAKL